MKVLAKHLSGSEEGKDEAWERTKKRSLQVTQDGTKGERNSSLEQKQF